MSLQRSARLSLSVGRCAAGAACTLVLAGSAAGQDWRQRYRPDDLLRIGVQAYRALPEYPSPSDASTFLRALANLTAYSEASPGGSRETAEQVRNALAWLHENIGAVTPPGTKGDDPHAPPRWRQLEERGLAAYGALRSGKVGSAFRPYAEAVTNLYAARQIVADLPEESTTALGWLSENPQVIRPGVKGDQAGEYQDASLPRSRKPSVFVLELKKRYKPKPHPGVDVRVPPGDSTEPH
jgi:hypothetical protein